jgi:murein DD-endopeptidase MepM/ murein hydrolase activator NlpD
MKTSIKTSSSLQIEIMQDSLLIQSGRGAQKLSLDFCVHNRHNTDWNLRSMELRVYAKGEQLVLRRRLDEQAASPSITTLPERKVPPKGTLDVLNPFFCFSDDLDLHRLHYLFHFSADPDQKMTLTADVYPRNFQQRVTLDLPLKGKIYVDDGNDFYSHHRRLTLNHPLIRQMGITTNMQRYAWDFMLVDGQGELYHPDDSRLENYTAFGAPVYAPGSGTIKALRTGLPDDPPDNPSLSVDDFIAEPILSMGNYLLIDHGTGEYSLLGHCQQGSISVKEGEQVERGQQIACLGNSGWTIFPHLHYQLMDDPDFLHAQVLPARFSAFTLELGDQSRALMNEYPDTGEFIIVT